MQSRSRFAVVAVAIAALGMIGTGARAADHSDSPRMMVNQALDVADLFAFQSPTNPRNTVLIGTFSTSAGVLGPVTFQQFANYDIEVFNVGGDALPDFTYRFVFSPPNGRGVQTVFLQRVAADGTATALASGPTGRELRIRGGGRMTAGVFDDPFFADILALRRFFARTDRGEAAGAAASELLNPPFILPPNNFFGNFNCLAVVLEIPSSQLLARGQGNQIGLNLRTEAFGVQFDRTALPTINTAIIPRPRNGMFNGLKDMFNSTEPADDRALYRDLAIGEISRTFGNPGGAAEVADFLLPDIMPFDVTDRSGFPNGRRLEDDVIDVELGVLTGGAVTTDRVKNDSTFRSRFPYMGVPQPLVPMRARGVRGMNN